MTVHFVNLIDELRRRSLRMASQVEDMLQEACETVFQPIETLATRVVARDQEVDEEEVAIETEVIRLLALYQPVGSDLRLLLTILKVTSDLERIADCAVNISERARHLELQEVSTRSESLKRLIPLARRSVRNAVQAYAAEDDQEAERVVADDPGVDKAYVQVVREVIDIVRLNPERFPAYLDLLSVAKNLERIADHSANIAEDVIYLRTGSIVRHKHDHAERLPPA